MHSLALVTNLAGPEGWIILVVVLLLFGGKKLPEVGRSIGASMREFSKGKNGEGEDETKETKL